jgi:hypothetical protein
MVIACEKYMKKHHRKRNSESLRFFRKIMFYEIKQFILSSLSVSNPPPVDSPTNIYNIHCIYSSRFNSSLMKIH